MSQPDRQSPEIREVAAELALIDGNAEAAITELNPTLHASAGIRNVVLVRAHILEALAREALGDMGGAEDAIERALDAAENETLVLPFVHIRSTELLERHPRHRTTHGALIDLILDVLSGKPKPPDRPLPAPMLDAVSEAEARVLGYLPTNLSASGIASELYVSVHTVKTHMRHIYARLDAHNRAEAVSRARELGLLGSTRNG
jgi:LuxR family maltose regulon positive regulatory protein